MAEKFSAQGRQVIEWARESARAFRHDYVGTEHLLIALLRQQGTAAARVLHSFGIALGQVESDVERIIGRGERTSPSELPFTPSANRALELTTREAQALGHDRIGPEDVLLGLAAERDGLAARMLLGRDATRDQLAQELVRTQAADRGVAKKEQG